MKLFTFLFLFLLTPLVVFAQERWVDLEWDAVPGAKSYELELFQDLSGTMTPRGKFKTDTPVWSRPVPSGKYAIRLRSLDARGVPGEWSDEIPLKIRLKNPQLLRPVPDDKINTDQIDLEWGEVEGAGAYQVVLLGPNDSVVLDTKTTELKASALLGTLGTYRWFVFALEKDEADRSEEEWPKTTFRGFNHVGGELEAPVVALSITDKLTLSWAKVPKAEGFEIDYLSPSGSGQKNNRFKVKKSPVAFSLKNLREGTTTLTIKAQAKGYLDSNKSIVKVSRSGEKVELEEVTQGKGQEVISVDPALVHWKTQYYLSILAGNYLYDSQNVSTDTSLAQKKLTALGFNVDLHLRPRLNSFLHKLNLSLMNLSSGVESGQLTHASYTLNSVKTFQRGRFHYGLGLGYLGLPSFMGDRLTDKVEVETTACLGPEAAIGVQYALAATWQIDFALQYLYQAHFLSSDRKQPTAFGYTRAAVNVLNYITKNEALFVMVDYRAWEQQWSKDKSSINGISFGLGLKGHFK